MAIADKAPSRMQMSVALRTAISILRRWGASTEQLLVILRISRSTYARVKRNEEVSLDADQLARTSMVLNSHAALRTVFDNPENVYGFMGMKNDNAYFSGRAPLEVMARGDVISVYETYRRIDALRSALW